MGRYLMFQVVRPTEGVRLVMSITGSYNADGNNLVPDATAIGEQRLALGACGRGSARLISPPLVPQRIDGRDYLMLDMGRPGQRFPSQRGGLMKLYGRDVALDRRLLVGFARDASAISEEEYRRLAPPSKLQAFPNDLAHADLEYSGLYEDGWCSEQSFACLSSANAPAAAAADGGSAAETAKVIVVRGVVPGIGDDSFRTEMRVLVDGVEVDRRTLSPGNFEVRAAAPAAPAGNPLGNRRRVELRFSGTQRLPGGDGRPVSAQLTFLGFADPTPADRGFARK
jgi:hypothetical protein